MPLAKITDTVKAKYFKCLDKGFSIIESAEKSGISIRSARRFSKEKNAEKVDLNSEKAINLKIKKFQNQNNAGIKNKKRFVFVSCQNDTDIDEKFYLALKRYCVINDAQLCVTPSYYKFNLASKFMVDESDMVFDDFYLRPNLRIATSIRILPTTVDPLAAKDQHSKGQTLIFSHPQCAMRSLPVLGGSPALFHTTGSLCKAKRCYEKTAVGQKAEKNHSLSAIVVELGKGDSFFIRGLNADSKSGFYDINGYYTADNYKKWSKTDRLLGLYLGDKHTDELDPNVVKATFTNKNSICKVLRPEKILQGDSFSCRSVSHHDDNNVLMRWGKLQLNIGDAEQELQRWIDSNIDLTPPDTELIEIGSNHNDHLYKWLTTADPKRDLTNAKLYHFLMYLMMDNIKSCPHGVSYPNLLKLWLDNSKQTRTLPKMRFLGRNESFLIADIECANHGDVSINGAKGSPASFARLPTKTIVGHSHSPSIKWGCYTVGTSSLKQLSYSGGASSWMHAHCAIYPNGKRQMIIIINDGWNAMLDL